MVPQRSTEAAQSLIIFLMFTQLWLLSLQNITHFEIWLEIRTHFVSELWLKLLADKTGRVKDKV